MQRCDPCPDLTRDGHRIGDRYIRALVQVEDPAWRYPGATIGDVDVLESDPPYVAFNAPIPPNTQDADAVTAVRNKTMAALPERGRVSKIEIQTHDWSRTPTILGASLLQSLLEGNATMVKATVHLKRASQQDIEGRDDLELPDADAMRQSIRNLFLKYDWVRTHHGEGQLYVGSLNPYYGYPAYIDELPEELEATVGMCRPELLGQVVEDGVPDRIEQHPAYNRAV